MPTQPLTLALVAGAFWLALFALVAAAPLTAKSWLNAASGWLGGALQRAAAGPGAKGWRDGPLILPGGGRSGRWMMNAEPAPLPMGRAKRSRSGWGKPPP